MRQDPNYYIALTEEIRMMNEKIIASASYEFSMFAKFKMGMSYRIDAGNFCIIDQDQKYSTNVWIAYCFFYFLIDRFFYFTVVK